jgi:hypothetical protein
MVRSSVEIDYWPNKLMSDKEKVFARDKHSSLFFLDKETRFVTLSQSNTEQTNKKFFV